MTDDAGLTRELAEARATIASQAMQIHALQQAAQNNGTPGALREVMSLAGVVSATVGEAPYRSLLRGIVDAAARLFEAEAASIALLDEDTNELVFEAASGDQEIVGMRFPAHQGIAGWVMMTGEAIAVSDVRRDPRFARDFAQSTGYVPRSILAVPLLLSDDVVGVLEVLDKATGASFGLAEMDLLALFARPAAVAVEQARMVTGVGTLLIRELGRLATEQGNDELARDAEAAVQVSAAPDDATLHLATLVQRISRRGERGQRLAIELLESVQRYLGDRG